VYSSLLAAKRTNVKLAVGLAVPLGLCVVALATALAVLWVKHRRRAADGARGGSGGGGKAGSRAGSSGGGGGGGGKGKQVRAGRCGRRAAARPQPAAAAPALDPAPKQAAASRPSASPTTSPSATPSPRPQPRRDQGKRRYTAPPLGALPNGQSVEELAAANLRAAGTSNGASTSGGAGGSSGGLTAEAVAAYRGDNEADADGGAEADLRPRLRSLGDSVTSAVRFELEEAEGLGDGDGASAGDGAAGGRLGSAGGGADQRGGPGGGDDGAPPLLSRRRTTSSTAAAPWPGPVETPPAHSGPSVVMGAANPPRVGTLASPFGHYNFGELLGPASAGGTGSDASASAVAASAGSGPLLPGAGGSVPVGDPASVGGVVVSVAPDGTWVAQGLHESIGLASGSSGSAPPSVSSGRLSKTGSRSTGPGSGPGSGPFGGRGGGRG
jgi:hypothetical protein